MFILDIMKCKKNKITEKERNEEIEQDIKIIRIVCKLGGLTEDETLIEINKLKINKQKQI